MKRERFIETVFAIVIGLAFLLPGAIVFGSLAGVVFPTQLGVNESYSELEGRPRQVFSQPTTETVSQGTFQTDFGQFVSDHIPFRNSVLLFNAAQQRGQIALANVTFGWPVYPTKYSSEYLAVPARNAVIHTAMSPSKKTSRAAKEWAKAISHAADSHPDVRFVYDILDDTYSSSQNPAHDLITDPYSKDWVDKYIIKNLGDNVKAIYDPIKSEDEMFDQWFSTEHHWKISRAMESYNVLASSLGWDEFSCQPKTYLDRWYGSSARAGLDLDWADSFEDEPTDFSKLSCTINGAKLDRGLREKVMRGESVNLPDPVFHYYHQWFGGPAAEIVYENPDGNGKTCLFVEQSYGVAIERYIALNYSKTICMDPQNCAVDKSFNDLIEGWDVDDVVIQFGYAYMTRVQERSPKLFN